MRPQSRLSPNNSIIARTRNLIQQATQSTVASSPNTIPGSSQSSPSHPHRILSRGKKRKIDKVSTKTFEIQVLKCSGDQEFAVSEEKILLKQVMVNLKSDDDEAQIRESIANAIEMRFPKIGPKYFEFLKRDRSKLYKPVTNEFKWDYPQIKTLIGQGKLYVRLLVDESLLLCDSDDLPEPPYSTNPRASSNSFDQQSSSSTFDQQSSPNTFDQQSSSSTFDQSSSSRDTMTTLREIFPNMSYTTIEEVYDDGKDVNEILIF